MTNLIFLLLLLITVNVLIASNKVKKNILDYTEADFDRLYQQWEENEEPLQDDELPEHERPSPKIDLSSLDMSDPESILKATKKGKTLMTFVTVYGKTTKEETEEITSLWQSSLRNNHIIAERYMIGDNRTIFMFKDGSQAWEAKEFLINQPFCDSVMIENKPYYGKYSPHVKQEL